MRRITFLCSTLLLLLLSCTDDDGEEVTCRAERMAEISAKVDDLISDKSCNGSDDCASIAWGSKPCGGPWSYLIYAPGNVDVAQLEQLVEEYNQLQKEVNQLTGAGSDCAVEEEPEVECADNVCRAKDLSAVRSLCKPLGPCNFGASLGLGIFDSFQSQLIRAT